ncbi:MAG: hypothetical protein H6673_10840 [Anaerolineales bacterium]|nr:hypothetical protein [Anaerolineales bacterium]
MRERPSRNYIRPILSVVLLLILLGGVSYRAVAPWLRELLQPSGDDFRMVLTGVTDQDCDGSSHVNLQGALEPTQTLCICGQLYTDESSVDYWLYMYTESGQVWANQSVKNQPQGAFCRVWHLPKQLEIGRYALAVRANPRLDPSNRLWFSVRQSYSPSASLSSSLASAALP